ncbi:hypothetical protein [Pseudoalteromonas sp. S2755]|uniref:hypothetical protein n=1 Tax=Pseudoalteromonas sp. S2755 TaxID=2066523 RepID=UPI00110C0BD1|nr:hypothetical protein [Pseudoalteromonas sp. S2755]TMN40806.1 hypothetical protein CWC03_08585 [Pseudoalteromonas sp. S2755]
MNIDYLNLDTEILIIISFSLFTLISIYLSIGKVEKTLKEIRKEREILNFKLDALLQQSNTSFPTSDMLSSELKEMIISGYELDCIKAIKTQFLCTQAQAERVVDTVKKELKLF